MDPGATENARVAAAHPTVNGRIGFARQPVNERLKYIDRNVWFKKVSELIRKNKRSLKEICPIDRVHRA